MHYRLTRKLKDSGPDSIVLVLKGRRNLKRGESTTLYLDEKEDAETLASLKDEGRFEIQEISEEAARSALAAKLAARDLARDGKEEGEGKKPAPATTDDKKKKGGE